MVPAVPMVPTVPMVQEDCSASGGSAATYSITPLAIIQFSKLIKNAAKVHKLSVIPKYYI